MSMTWWKLALAALLPPLVLLTASDALAQSDAAIKGKALYEARCSVCHSVDSNRIGPMHNGVFGRKAGSVAGYDYSAALKQSSVVWNEESLNRWLRNPESLIPGQKMAVSVPNEADRALLIDYLRSISSVEKQN
jgi:cytochrome c